MLRMTGLGSYTPLEYRNELTLFLCKGMWQWSQWLEQRCFGQELNCGVARKTTSRPVPLVQIFAAMIMNAIQA